MKFGDKLIALRKKKGLSQEELAEKLGVSRQSVSTRAKVSIQNSSRTSVLRLARRTAPSASATLVKSTRPSGIIPSTAATVSSAACS